MNNDSNVIIDDNSTTPVNNTPETTLVQPAPAEPVQPAPAEPVQPAPVEPIQPAPVEPVQPAPVEPIQPAPVEPVQPAPVEPIQPAPAEPVQPAPAKPVQPAPAEPVQPAPAEPTITIGDKEEKPMPAGEIKQKGQNNKRALILFGIIIVLGGVFAYLLLGKGKTGSTSGGSETPTTNGNVIENVTISGYSCFDSTCNVSIEDVNGTASDYTLSVTNTELFQSLDDYKDYIKLNIYVADKDGKKSIVDYKVFSKANNEDITSTTEEELRTKLGMFSLGTNTSTFTVKEFGGTGFGTKDDNNYTYENYVLVDSNNIEYEMKYIIADKGLNLVVGSQYSVTFDTAKDSFGYEYTITKVE